MAVYYHSHVGRRDARVEPRVGDIVRLRNGVSPMKVTDVCLKFSNVKVTASYGKNCMKPKVRSCSEFVCIAQEGEEIPEEYRTQCRERHGMECYSDEEIESSVVGIKVEGIKPIVHLNYAGLEKAFSERASKCSDHIADAMIRGHRIGKAEQMHRLYGGATNTCQKEKLEEETLTVGTLKKVMEDNPYFRTPSFRMEWPSVFDPKSPFSWRGRCTLTFKNAEQENEMRQHYGKLFETIGDTLVDGNENPIIKYGTLTAVNSDGLLVLQMQEGGAYQSFKPEEVRIVAPHTIRVMDIEDGDSLIWETQKGAVQVDEVLMSGSGNLYKVMEIDTDNERGDKPQPNLRRLQTEAVDL